MEDDTSTTGVTFILLDCVVETMLLCGKEVEEADNDGALGSYIRVPDGWPAGQ